MRSAKPSGKPFKSARRIRCLLIADRQRRSRATLKDEAFDNVSFPLTPALSLGERRPVRRLIAQDPARCSPDSRLTSPEPPLATLSPGRVCVYRVADARSADL